MNRSASAVAKPTAGRKAVRTSLQACFCAFGLHLAMTSALAESGLTNEGDDRSLVHASLLNSFPTEAVPAEFHYKPSVTPLRTSLVTSSAIRAERIAVPKRKPVVSTNQIAAKPPVQQAAVATPARQLKPTVLFGSRGKPVSLSPVTKRWQRALGALEADTPGSAEGRHGFRAYKAILDQVKPQRRGLQIPRVNYMVNRLLAYRLDPQLWNAGEYWASPVETLTKRAGDCEDYAILKYALLRDLGVKDEDMRIVVLRDTAARQYHAVLSVRHKGDWLILDNRFSRVRFERDLPHYKALYTVNAAGEWQHEPHKGKPVRLAARLKSANQ